MMFCVRWCRSWWGSNGLAFLFFQTVMSSDNASRVMSSRWRSLSPYLLTEEPLLRAQCIERFPKFVSAFVAFLVFIKTYIRIVCAFLGRVETCIFSDVILFFLRIRSFARTLTKETKSFLQHAGTLFTREQEKQNNDNVETEFGPDIWNSWVFQQNYLIWSAKLPWSTRSC